jgi:hypothetical protein
VQQTEVEDLARQLMEFPDADSWLGRVAEKAGQRAS